MNCNVSHCRHGLPTGVETAFRSARPDWYRRLHAWALSQGNARYEAAIGPAKRALLGSLEGEVLEVGPGTGGSLRYFPSTIRWIGVEPNPHARDYLLREAARLGRDATVLDGVAERLPLPDASVDAVVSSLVLCSVSEPARALAEIRRVLRPGGKFVFIEHVAAEPGTGLHRLQRLMRGPQALLGDGCRPDQDTLAAIEAAGFAWVLSCSDRLPVPLVGPHVLGYALR